MPFCVGGCFDAVGAWIRLNARYFHCYLCSANYEQSWLRPSAGALLPLNSSRRDYKLRQIANDATRTAADRRIATKKLKTRNLNPEITAWDKLALVQMHGRRCMIPDCFHCGELGPNKLIIFGIKLLCDESCAVAGRGHSVSAASALLDDYISWYSRHKSGYHSLPGVSDFTAVRQFTGMMVRSLLFSLLAAMCSIEDLFNEKRQTALVNNLTGQIQLMRFINARRWDAATPDNIDILYSFIEDNWEDSIGDFVCYERVKIHLTAHWRQLYLDMGTPVQWSTQHGIEALQRILKAAWRRTNKLNPAEQILRRIAVLRFIYGTLLPAYGVVSETVSAMTADRQTQAYLSGTVKPVHGVTSPFKVPANAAESAANNRLRNALREAQIVHPDPLDDSGDPAVLALPLTHNIDWRRVYPRRFGFFSRKGICAVSVPAFPQGALDDLEGAHAVFSMFSDDAVPGGVAAAQQAAAAAEDQPTAVSSKEYFFVEGWLSYDITGLSDATPNEAPAGPRLSPSEQNSRYRAVDLAVGRRGVVQDYISPPALMRGVAQRVFQRVKLLT